MEAMEDIEIGAANLIENSVHHPILPPPADSAISHAAIYVPRGPLLNNPQDDALNISALQSVLPCHVVEVQYRCSRDHPFPTPLHDVITGFDWVKENLLSKRAITRPGRSERVGRIAIVGELIGGQLATALALSECRAGEPGIVAAAVNNPIVDWPGLGDPEDDLSLDYDSSNPLRHEALLNQRTAMFRRPDAYFDPFASPVLFFRSAGMDVPPSPRELITNDMDELVALEREDFFRSQLALSAVPVPADGSDIAVEAPAAKPKRKASRRFPSAALKLRLPRFWISAGLESPLEAQASELAAALRKSFHRANLNAYARPYPADMVEDQISTGLGLWDSTDEGRLRMFHVAHWLREAFDHSSGESR